MKRDKRNFITDHLPLFFGIFVLLGLSIYHIVLNDIWIDEASSLTTAAVPLNRVFNMALVWESQAPLYYFLLALWMKISPSYFFARALSLIVVVAFLIVVYRIISKYDKSKWVQALFMILVASSHFVVLSAFTIRYFGLTLLLSTILIDMFLRKYLKDDPPTLKIRGLFVAISTFAVLTQYYMGILLLAFGITLWMDKGFKRFLNYCADMALPILALGILFNIICSQYSTLAAIQGATPSIFGAIGFGIRRIENTIINQGYFIPSRYARHALRLFYFIVAIAVFMSRKKIPAWGHHLLKVVILNILGLMVLYFFIHFDFIHYWHILFFSVSIVLFMYFGVVALKEKWGLIIFSIFILLNLYSVFFYLKPTRTLATLNQYLERNEKAGENIFVYPNIYKDVFQFQYTGKNQLFAIPYKIDYAKGYNLELWALKGDSQLDSFFSKNRLPGHEYFYLFGNRVHNLSYVDFKFGQFDQYLTRNFTLVSDTSFEDYTLKKYKY